MKDILLAIVFVLILIPIFHFTTNVAPNVFTTGFFVLIMIPTLITLINGAPFVPTPMAACRKMMKLAKIKPGEPGKQKSTANELLSLMLIVSWA